MDIRIYLERGWQAFLTFIGPVLLLTVVMLLLSLITIGILAPVMSAGYMYSLLQALRTGRRPEIGDLFSHMRLFFPLLLFAIVCAFFILIGYALFFVPGFFVTLFLIYACLYLFILMPDRNKGLFEGIRMSWEMATLQPMGDHIIIAVLYVIIVSIGSSVPFLILLAQPLATFILLAFYEDRVRLLSGEWFPEEGS